MLIAFFKISRWRLRYSFSFCSCRIFSNISSGLSGFPSSSPGFNCPQVRSLPQRQRVIAHPELPSHLRLPLATVNQQLHRLALELLVVSLLNLLFLHGFSLLTLSFRVRKIRGASDGKDYTPFYKGSDLSPEMWIIG